MQKVKERYSIEFFLKLKTENQNGKSEGEKFLQAFAHIDTFNKYFFLFWVTKELAILWKLYTNQIDDWNENAKTSNLYRNDHKVYAGNVQMLQ